MSSQTQRPHHIPLDWLKPVSPDLISNDDVPLFGAAPAFPWSALIEFLQAKLHAKHFYVSRSNITQKSGEDILAGVGSPSQIHAITVSPLNQPLYFAMSDMDVTKLMSALLTTEETPLPLQSEMTQPFFTFMVMEAIHSINKASFDQSLSFQMETTPEEFSFNTAHCFDVYIELNQTKATGRVVIPPAFRQAWKSHYIPKSLSVPLNPALAEKIELAIHLQAGHIHMPLREWKTIKPGDFIGLDSCSLEPSGKKGRVLLTVNGDLLFRGKLKDGNIKILEHPLYREDLAPMPNKKFDDDEENVDFSESGTEFSEEETEFSTLEETENYDQTEEEVEEEHQEEQYHEDDEEAFNSVQEENEVEAAEEEHSHAPAEKPHRILSTKPVAPHEIPLDIVVEVGRIRMSIQKIMELQPGNMLELDIHPENGVDLVVNGQKIAKAELLSLGDNLGVRIIDIG